MVKNKKKNGDKFQFKKILCETETETETITILKLLVFCDTVKTQKKIIIM